MKQRDGSVRSLISSDKFFKIWKYDQIKEDSDLTQRFSEAFSKVFSAKGEGEWDANYGFDQARQELKDDIQHGKRKIKCFTMEDDKNVVHGFAYGYIINSDCLGSGEAPFYFDEAQKGPVIETLKKELSKRIGRENFFYFDALGIVQKSRKGQALLRLQKLSTAMLEEVRSEGVKHILSYTMRSSKLYTICRFMEAEELLRLEDEKKIVYLLQNTNIISYSRWGFRK